MSPTLIGILYGGLCTEKQQQSTQLSLVGWDYTQIYIVYAYALVTRQKSNLRLAAEVLDK